MSRFQHKRSQSRKPDSLDEVFRSTEYSDSFFPHPEFLATRDTNLSKATLQRCLKTEASCSKKWLRKKSVDSLERIRLLAKVRSVCREYEVGREISESMCRDIHSVLEMLINQESIYGKDMQHFFVVLMRLIFCENQSILGSLHEFSEGEKKPYNYLVMKVIQEKHRQLQQKSKEIENQVVQITNRIEEIDRQYREKTQIMMIQHENGITAMKTQHHAEVSQLNHKISMLRQTIQTYERKFRKTGLEATITAKQAKRRSKEQGNFRHPKQARQSPLEFQ